MSNITRLQLSGQVGLTVKAVLRDGNGAAWNGVSLVTYAAADYDDYKVAMTAQGVHYYADIPTNLPPARYHVTYQHEVGGVLTESSKVISQYLFDWDGTSVVDSLVIGSSVADICNMALAHLGSGHSFTNLETDNSEESESLKIFYENTRDQALRDFAWPFAVRLGTLSLVEEDPNDEWGYSYRYPVNALRLLRIPGGIRNESLDNRIPYRIAGDDSGRLIFTDREDAEIEYIAQVKNPLHFTPDFVSALSYLLAAKVATKLTAGDAFKLGQKAMELYVYEIAKAKAMAVNEEAQEPQPDSEFIRIRG
jgi:hypothetical protein